MAKSPKTCLFFLLSGITLDGKAYPCGATIEVPENYAAGLKSSGVADDSEAAVAYGRANGGVLKHAPEAAAEPDVPGGVSAEEAATP
ncbi:hypothetical protein ACTSKR_07655 [Chitinibacteraceae bacterium HSL-7]